ncbi:hypothetical protein Halru_3024 [Halovivax ruber XH-70]|uniref:Uncharacterized protein n=1 Tax=Halovivax ruber (strain DSM 18193 / JCM 13892 / XH-70) TaxID=797302 RepID=L0IDF0_HALRX|nr:DUF6339 family protein [Halovivax ruber]AGB17590.1 hypothetical protein Halru_3024 [Halovivax ruber XH-70]
MTETELHRLTEDGRRLVGESFMRGEATLTEEQLAEYVETMPGNPTADLDKIDSAVTQVLEEYPEHETEIDGALAEDIHRGLDITRRTAGDPGLWHWLAVVRYPDLVRHRWEYRSEEAMREKFLGAGSDLYSNAIHRLWWIAELTARDDDYSTTDAVFDNQTMVNKVFDRWFARYQPAVRAMCEELEDEKSSVIDETTRRFNHALTNVQLEGLSESDAREMVRKIITESR